MIIKEQYTNELFPQKYLICKCDQCRKEFEVDPEATKACEEMEIRRHVCSEECAEAMGFEFEDETDTMS